MSDFEDLPAGRVGLDPLLFAAEEARRVERVLVKARLEGVGVALVVERDFGRGTP